MFKNVVPFHLPSLILLIQSIAATGQVPADTNIYDRIMSQICNCLPTVPGKDSLEKRSYCYQQVLIKNYDELKKYGVDTLADAAFKTYYPLYLKRFKNSEPKNISTAKDESMVGEFISQKKVSGSNYEITVFSKDENRSLVFISDKALDENELKLLPKSKDNLVISYRTEKSHEKTTRVVKSVVYLR